MTRIAPAALDGLPQAQRRTIERAAELMGFTANDALAMAHWPELLGAFGGLVDTVYASTAIDPVLKRLVAMTASAAAGCRYCEAHTAHGAVRMAGGDAAKLAAVWEYRTSDLFSEADRAALDLAFAAGQQPNAATDDHFSALRAHYDTRQITEIVAVISLFGFLNRWNTTLATKLEDAPRAFAAEHIPAGSLTREPA